MKTVLPGLLFVTLVTFGQGVGSLFVHKDGPSWRIQNNNAQAETVTFTQPGGESDTVKLSPSAEGVEGSADRAEKTFYCVNGSPRDEQTGQSPTFDSESVVCDKGVPAGVDEQAGNSPEN
jgi:hypothetical protein